MKVYIQSFFSEYLFNEVKRKAQQDQIQGKAPPLRDYYHSVLQLFPMLHKFLTAILKGLDQIKLAFEGFEVRVLMLAFEKLQLKDQKLKDQEQKEQKHGLVKTKEMFQNALEGADNLMRYLEDIRINRQIDEEMEIESDNM